MYIKVSPCDVSPCNYQCWQEVDIQSLKLQQLKSETTFEKISNRDMEIWKRKE
jgi:hypothetical protein